MSTSTLSKAYFRCTGLLEKSQLTTAVVNRDIDSPQKGRDVVPFENLPKLFVDLTHVYLLVLGRAAVITCCEDSSTGARYCTATSLLSRCLPHRRFAVSIQTSMTRNNKNVPFNIVDGDATADVALHCFNKNLRHNKRRTDGVGCFRLAKLV